jgi:hypothetical protein
MDAQFLAQLPQVEAMCLALYTSQVGAGMQMQLSVSAALYQAMAASNCSVWHSSGETYTSNCRSTHSSSRLDYPGELVLSAVPSAVCSCGPRLRHSSTVRWRLTACLLLLSRACRHITFRGNSSRRHGNSATSCFQTPLPCDDCFTQAQLDPGCLAVIQHTSSFSQRPAAAEASSSDCWFGRGSLPSQALATLPTQTNLC